MSSRRWFVSLTTVAILWLAPMFSMGYSGISISLYNVLVPILFFAAVLAHPWRLTKWTATYLACLCLLVFAIAIMGLWNSSPQTVASHILALAGTTAATVFIQRMEGYLYALVLVGITVITADLFAAVGILPVANTASPVLPIGYGGIGVEMGFGLHGIIVGSAVVGAFALLLTDEIKEHQMIYIFTIVGGVIVIALSQSRSSMLATPVGMGVVAVPAIRRKRWLWFFSGFVAISGVASGLWLIARRPNTLRSRIEGVRTALGIVATHPLTGIGWNRFYPLYSDLVLHFTPLNYAVASGVGTFALYVILLVTPIMIFGPQMLTVDFMTAGTFGVYCVVFVELLLFKSTPSVQLFTAGAIVISFVASHTTSEV